jgi:hypothetical protein
VDVAPTGLHSGPAGKHGPAAMYLYAAAFFQQQRTPFFDEIGACSLFATGPAMMVTLAKWSGR